jgi:hypothetical protein
MRRFLDGAASVSNSEAASGQTERAERITPETLFRNN